VTYKDYVDVCSKDMPTLAPHLSRHPKGICEEQQFWLEERRKMVRGNDKIPGREEPHKLSGSMKSRKQRAYIEANRTNRFIQRSSPAAAPIRFAKKDGGQRLFVDYGALNKATQCVSPHPNQGRRRVQNHVSHPARSSSTESCRSG